MVLLVDAVDALQFVCYRSQETVGGKRTIKPNRIPTFPLARSGTHQVIGDTIATTHVLSATEPAPNMLTERWSTGFRSVLAYILAINSFPFVSLIL
ncbi:hypothetical protein Psta_3717 [Pirellula staleyi DSM 6068]|uniref:Uncharacterized protein n=1 Tax=Pirellula staleyi (strain ATCC 27377 / DSM 6068 / ICPB 4128) TaxID=530564 RepID=D2R007_PIRSD|nr:hypothetical protein Psta_3717 [Pirellula staleyi DSM 6068]